MQVDVYDFYKLHKLLFHSISQLSGFMAQLVSAQLS